MDGIIDTAIIIDIYRGHQPAIKWRNANKKLSLAITPIVWMEAVSGAPNKQKQADIRKMLSVFAIVYGNQADQLWAMQQLQRFYLSHNVGVLDALIAAPAHRLGIPLYTRNLKHFTPMLPSLAQKPY